MIDTDLIDISWLNTDLYNRDLNNTDLYNIDLNNTDLIDLSLKKKELFDKYLIEKNSKNIQMQCKMNCSRNFNRNLAGNDIASQYQRQKIIQNTVRVKSSLYTMNLAGLSGYQKPLNVPQLVEQAGTQYFVPAKTYWNQMSDRARPSNQVTKVASGAAYHSSSTRHTITRNRPGAMSPGGIGVDIKHNSYDRYLNKIKGKGPLRRGAVNFDSISSPVYGGKFMKTSIINNCNCPEQDNKQDKLIYGSANSALQDQILSMNYTFKEGDFVWAKKSEIDTNLYKGEIINIMDELYTVKFEDNIIINIPYCELTVYFDCKCVPPLSFIEQILLNNPNNRINPITCTEFQLGRLLNQQ